MSAENFRFQDESGAITAVSTKILAHSSDSSLTRKFPKSARLLTSTEYKFLQRHSTRLFGQQIAVNFRQGKSSSPKLGITVSKRFGKAHDRNRFKRVVREAFRELYAFLPQGLELNVSPRSQVHLSKEAILLDLKSLLAKITFL